MKVFCTADDATTAAGDEATAAPTEALTQEPGGTYCTVGSQSTTKHSDTKVSSFGHCVSWYKSALFGHHVSKCASCSLHVALPNVTKRSSNVFCTTHSTCCSTILWNTWQFLMTEVVCKSQVLQRRWTGSRFTGMWGCTLRGFLLPLNLHAGWLAPVNWQFTYYWQMAVNDQIVFLSPCIEQ